MPAEKLSVTLDASAVAGAAAEGDVIATSDVGDFRHLSNALGVDLLTI